MNTNQQKEFVSDLMHYVEGEIIKDIDKGKVPESWGGFELRQLILDRFKLKSFTMSKAHKAKYDNTVLINGL